MSASQRQDLEHIVRALSHDLKANFMLLEGSFNQLKRAIGRQHDGISGAGRQHQSVPSRIAHVDACLRQSRTLLDDLVQLARTGTVDMQPGAVDLEAIADEVLHEQRDLIARQGVRAVVERPLPVCWCNRMRLKQVVTNLVRNALLHGCRRDRARVVIATAQPSEVEDEGRRWVAFRVSDNGPGIDARFREEVFLPGRRLPGSNAEGSGYGLAIVRKIVEYYGGAVYVDPNVSQGASMVVVLPAPADELRPGPPSELLDEGRRWKLQLEAHAAAEHEHLSARAAGAREARGV